MCDALNANGDVKTIKKDANVCDGGDIKHGLDFSYVCDARHAVDPEELFAMMQNNRTGSQMRVCVIYGIQFTRMNCV